MIQDSGQLCFQINEDMGDERIDKCLSVLIDSLSRSYIQKLLKDEKITVNGIVVKANYKVKVDDEIRFDVPPAEEPDILPEDIPLDILYEDADVLVVNKPKGMVVHPAAGHYNNTLVNAVMFHCHGELSGINGVMRPGIVHRIDRDTTGSVIICKNDFSHNHIACQLKEHSIVRKYHAICYGVIKEEEGSVNAPVGRHPTDRKRMAVNEKNGKYAVTHYKVLKRFNGYTYIECMLETGRTHQIRVHMASIGHPLLGDEVYAGNRKSPFKLEGQCLHAKTLGFVHPRSLKYIETNAPLPDYFTHLLEIL
ncbi:RluA family pseudouridine synthase [Kineothrix sedimenti]|uniref:Pseudouridine synthase n=1 Tax=Kineothrix sedimenti TaxID=3123317 RepID=A0ABZ3ERD8_9FIRM